MIITLGNGTCLLQTVSQGDRHGLLIRPNQEKHGIDETLPNEDPRNNEYEYKESDLLIWCENLEGARVLQDKVNVLALRLNGYDKSFDNVDLGANGEEEGK